MKGRWGKVGTVIAGYVAAMVAAVVVAWMYDVWAAAQPYDTSGGMYAAGQMMSSVAAFLLVALVPTLLGLWFLRRHTGFWNVVGIASLAFAAAGLVAVLVQRVHPDAGRSVTLMLVGLLALSQLLGVPVWSVAFAVFAWLAPTRASRRTLMVAVGIELVIGVVAFVHWFGRSSPL